VSAFAVANTKRRSCFTSLHQRDEGGSRCPRSGADIARSTRGWTSAARVRGAGARRRELRRESAFTRRTVHDGGRRLQTWPAMLARALVRALRAVVGADGVIDRPRARSSTSATATRSSARAGVVVLPRTPDEVAACSAASPRACVRAARRRHRALGRRCRSRRR
jgi:hypothetical protein